MGQECKRQTSQDRAVYCLDPGLCGASGLVEDVLLTQW